MSGKTVDKSVSTGRNIEWFRVNKQSGQIFQPVCLMPCESGLCTAAPSCHKLCESSLSSVYFLFCFRAWLVYS